MLIRNRFVDAFGVLTDRWCEPGSQGAKLARFRALMDGEYLRCLNTKTDEQFDLHPGWLTT